MDRSSSVDSDSDNSYKGISITSDEEYSPSIAESSDDDSETAEFQPMTQPPAMSTGSTTDHETASLQTTYEESSVSQSPRMFRLCGDNIDKTVRQRCMRSGTSKTDSIHYFHSYAPADRIDFSYLSDKTLPFPDVDLNQLATSILPSADDDQALQDNFATLISRVLVENVDYFKRSFDGVVNWHVKHEFYQQMAQKSEVVSVILLYS